STDIDVPTLYLVHEMCDSMINDQECEKCYISISKKKEQESSSFYNPPIVKKNLTR
ncbi:hypothetical protein S245_018012, partial [Arachis hypogaea]